jgi:hypothetical protein
MDYFKAAATEGSISGDDVNRRFREASKGFKAPSADWVNCKRICRCLWAGQVITEHIHLDGYYHHAPKLF